MWRSRSRASRSRSSLPSSRPSAARRAARARSREQPGERRERDRMRERRQWRRARARRSCGSQSAWRAARRARARASAPSTARRRCTARAHAGARARRPPHTPGARGPAGGSAGRLVVAAPRGRAPQRPPERCRRRAVPVARDGRAVQESVFRKRSAARGRGGSTRAPPSARAGRRRRSAAGRREHAYRRPAAESAAASSSLTSLGAARRRAGRHVRKSASSFSGFKTCLSARSRLSVCTSRREPPAAVPQPVRRAVCASLGARPRPTRSTRPKIRRVLGATMRPSLPLTRLLLLARALLRALPRRISAWYADQLRRGRAATRPRTPCRAART